VSELEVVYGDEGPFVCPWCGAQFTRRHVASDGVESLEEHWRASPECSANRMVSSPLPKDRPGPDEKELA
jgi:hypothetical protein